MAALLRAPAAEDTAYLFKLAAECDLRWPAVSRFGAVCTPQSVLTALQSAVEVGYLVQDAKKQPVGVIGFVDADPGSQVMWLDGHCSPGDGEALLLLRQAVPIVLDEAERAGTVRFVYYEEYSELDESLVVEHRELWESEVVIPQYVSIDGTWCTRVTLKLEMATWANRN